MSDTYNCRHCGKVRHQLNPGACPTCNDNPNFLNDLFEENDKLKKQVAKLKKQVKKYKDVLDKEYRHFAQFEPEQPGSMYGY